MRVPAALYLLLVALRVRQLPCERTSEAARLELEPRLRSKSLHRQDRQGHRQHSAPEHDSFLLLRSRQHQSSETLVFPTECVDGQMEVDLADGKHEVTKEANLKCNVTFRGRGAEVSLAARVAVDGNVRFRGQMGFTGSAGFESPCMHVEGSAYVEADAAVLFQNCSNRYIEGGALAVLGDMIFDNGVLRAHNCHSSTGGAVFVQGSLHLRGGLLEISSCSAGRSGGALYTRGILNITAGSLRINDSFTESNRDGGGGAVYSRDGFEISGGEFVTQNTWSKHEGGAISSPGPVKLAGGRVEIRDAHAKRGGAIFCKDEIAILAGDVLIRNTSGFEGGAFYSWLSGMKIAGGRVEVEAAESAQAGGAIFTHGSFELDGGDVLMRNTSTGKEGGAIRSLTFVRISAGSLKVQESRALVEYGRGGAIYTSSNVIVLQGDVSLENTSAGERGGAIFCEGSVQLEGGRLHIRGSSSQVGGAILSVGSVSVADGELLIERTASTAHGGAIWTDHDFKTSGGKVFIKDSMAGGNGGAVRSSRAAYISSSKVVVHNTSAKSSGGAFAVAGGFSVANATLDISASSSALDGGALDVRGGDFNVSSALLRISGCSAGWSGGAIYLGSGSINQLGDGMLLRECHAGDRGGLIFAAGGARFQGNLHLASASADEGGCLFAGGDVSVAGETRLEQCTATGAAGGLFARGNLRLQNASFEACEAAAAASFVAKAGATVKHLHINGTCAGAQVLAAGGLHAESIDCLQSQSCGFSGPRMHVPSLLCGRGEGRSEGIEGIACEPCAEDHTRLTMARETCSSCPNITNVTIVCERTRLAVPPGVMVSLDLDTAADLSNWSRCPNALACPGGELHAGAAMGDRVQVVTPMCLEGYEGHGCTRCSAEYARGDTNVLQCVKCATTQLQVVQYVSFYLAQQLALFASAVASVTSAKSERAASSTLLNQLMAFAAVAGIAMSAAMQTQAFQRLRSLGLSFAQDMIEYSSLPVTVAQGQGSGPSMSGECLLPLLTGDVKFKTVHHTHLLMSVWPAILVAGLALAKSGWLAAVVGTNLFLPSFTAAFGKYLVAFRLRPEGELLGELRLDFLPPGPPAFVVGAVLAGISISFLLGVGSWIHVVQSRKDPPESHVSYLMQAYKTECSVWEVERLVRKMLLALVTTIFPVTLSPALQMTLVNLILITSLVLYFWYRPYKADADNNLEMGLLVLAVVITGLTTCLLANDLHWAQSALTQNLLLFIISGLAAGVCMTLMVRFGLAFYRERAKRSEDKTEA